MRPFRSASGLAVWILRAATFLLILSIYWTTVEQLNFKSFYFYIATIYTVFGALLFIGGLFSKHTITVLSGLILFIISIYEIFHFYQGSLLNSGLASYLLLSAIGLFFLSRGNKN
jgi:hypothetical protein